MCVCESFDGCLGQFYICLNCRLQVENVSVKESAGSLLVLAWLSLRFLSFNSKVFYITTCWLV